MKFNFVTKKQSWESETCQVLRIRNGGNEGAKCERICLLAYIFSFRRNAERCRFRKNIRVMLKNAFRNLCMIFFFFFFLFWKSVQLKEAKTFLVSSKKRTFSKRFCFENVIKNKCNE